MTLKEWYTSYRFDTMQENKKNKALYSQFIAQVKIELPLSQGEKVDTCFCYRASIYKRVGKYLKATDQI